MRNGKKVLALALLLAVLVLSPSQGLAQTPPAAPAYALAIVGNGTLAVSWGPVSDAAKYELAYSSDNGANWTSHANDLTATKVTISGINYTKVYVGRVRAGNDNGWSAWKVTNPTEPYSDDRVVTTPISDESKRKLNDLNSRLRDQRGGDYGLPSPSPTPAPYVHFTDVTHTTATLNLVNNKADWSYKRGSGSCSTAQSGSTASVGLTGLTGDTTYDYKAYSAAGCLGSPMAFASFTTLPPPHVTNLGTVSSVGSGISPTVKQGAAFTTGPYKAGYTLRSITASLAKNGNVTPSNLTLTLHEMEGTNPYDNQSSYPSSTTKATLTGTAPTSTSFTDTVFTCSGSGCKLDPGTTYFVVATYTGTSGNYAWRYAGSNNVSRYPSNNGWNIGRSHEKSTGNPWRSWGDWHMVRVDFEYNPTLTASNVTSSSATLTLANHTGTWYSKRIHPTTPAAFCSVGVTGATQNRDSLTSNATYAYTAYSDSTCRTALDTAYFSTTDAAVGNLAEKRESSNWTIGGSTDIKYANAFTTGGHSFGYTLAAVTLDFAAKTGSPGDISVALHAADTGNSSNPAATASATLSGSDPDAAGLQTYTCSGSGCGLSSNTTYFIVTSAATGSGSYNQRNTASDDQTLQNAVGWSIADAGRSKTGTNAWAAATQSAAMRVAANVKPPTLSASSVTSTGATLTIANHTGNWHHKETFPSTTATCSTANTGTTASLSSLTADKTYAFTAYSDSGCTAANALAAAYFSTTDDGVGNLNELSDFDITVGRGGPNNQSVTAPFTTGSAASVLKGVTLRFGDKSATGTPGAIQVTLHEPDTSNGSNPSSTTKATLTGSNPDTAGLYTYTCSSGCYLKPGSTYFVKVAAPSAAGAGAYSLSLTQSDDQVNHPSANGWAIGDQGRHMSKRFPWSGHALGRVAVMHAAANDSATLAASSVGATTATLTIGGHTAQWWYKADKAPDTTCQGPVAANTSTKALTGLTAGEEYVYSAYDATGCADADLIAVAAAFATNVSVSNLSETAGSATMNLQSNNGWAQEFTTGSAGSYSIQGVTVDFKTVTGASAITVAIHGKSSGNPAAAARATLTGTPAAGQAAFTCDAANANNNCSLEGSASYFVHVSATSGAGSLDNTDSNAQTLQPSNNGWSIADTATGKSGGTWTSHATASMLIKVEAAPQPTLTAGSITDTGATLTMKYHSGDWWFKADKGFFSGDCESVSGTTRTLGNYLAKATTYVFTAYGDSGCTTANALDTATFTTTGKALRVTNVSGTGATLAIVGHTAAWWYKADSGPDTTCQSVAANTPSDTLTGLTDGNTYTYTAYSASGCAAANELDSVTFSTSDVSVGNLEELTNSEDCQIGFNFTSRKCAAAFTTGSHSGGHTLKSVTALFDAKTGNPGNIIVAIHAADTANSSHPASTASITLTGSNPGTAGLYTYTCSTGCDLTASTTYFVVMSTADTSQRKLYAWERTTSDYEVVTPSTATGWAIADGGLENAGSGWTTTSRPSTGVMHVAADEKPALTASNIGATTVTLTRSGYVGNWRYKYTTPATPAGACSAAQTKATANVTSLTANTTYVFKLYAGTDATCATPLATAAQFTTPIGFTASSTPISATLTLAGHTGNWWLKRTSPADTNCISKGATYTHSVTALTANSSYTYKAYDKANCLDADEIVSETFTTPDYGDLREDEGFGASLSTASNVDPADIWSNGTTMWVADTVDKKLYAYKMSDKTRDSSKDFNTLDAAENDNPFGIWSNGTTMWVSDTVDKKLYAYKMSDKTRDSSKDFNTLDGAGNDNPTGIWSDGATMWVADSADDRIYGYDMTSRSTSGTWTPTGEAAVTECFPPPIGCEAFDFDNDKPAGIWSDGVTMWVSDTDDPPIFAYKASDKTRDADKDIIPELHDEEHHSHDFPGHEGVWSGGATVWASNDEEDTIVAYYAFPTLTAGSVANTTATLTLSNFGAAWHYKATTGPHTTCQGPVSAGTATKSLTGLTAGTSYVYSAYSDSTCTAGNLIAMAASFTTLTTGSMTATSVTATSATLSLPNHTGAWYYQISSGLSSGPGSGGASAASSNPPDDCVGPINGQANLSHLGSNTTYTITAYAGQCTGNAIASGTFATIQSTILDPTNVTVYRGYDGAQALGSRGVMHVKWDAVTGATSYKVARTSNWHDFTETTVTTNSARLTGFDHTGYYWVRVQAVGANNVTSGWGWSSISYTAIDPRPVYKMTLTRADAGLNVSWKQCDVHEDWCNGGSPVTGFQIDLSADNGTTWTKVWEDTPANVTVTNSTTDANGITTGDAAATVCGADNDKSYKVRIGVTSRVATAWSLASTASSTVGTYTPTPGARYTCEDFDTLSAAGNHPNGLWSDGVTMWALDFSDDKIYAYDMATKARDDSKDITLEDKTLWYDVTSDGTTIWASESSTLDKLYAYDVDSGARVSSKDFSLHSDNDWARGIWTDGVTMYVQDDTDNKIYAYVLSTQVRDSGKDITLHADNANGEAMWSDGVTMWVVDPTDDKAYAYSLSDGARDSAKDYTGLSANVNGIWSDGATAWMADSTSGAPKIYAYHSIDPAVPVPAPAAVNAYRGWKFVEAEWTAVDGATGYNVEHYHPWNQALQGKAWVTVATNTTATSVKVTRKNWPGDVVRVQAVRRLNNKDVTGAWANSNTVPQVLQLQLPASNVVVSRSTGKLHVSWTQCDVTTFACHGGTPITHWLVNVSADNGKTWTNVNRLTGYTSGSLVTLTGSYDDNKAYKVSIGVATRFRTVWAEASTGTTKRLTVSNVAEKSATLTIVNHTGNWWFKADTGYYTFGCHDAASKASVNLGNRLQKRTAHTFTAYSDSGCTTPLGAVAQFTTTGAALSFTNVTATTATMAIDGHTGAWWYDAETGPHTSCQSVTAGTASVSLGLTSGGPTYTYTAYKAAGCADANAIDTATFSTTDAAAGNLREVPYGLNCFAGRPSGTVRQCATAFTTGANANGYTLRSVTARFSAEVSSPGDFFLEIRQASGSAPAATTVATLSGSDPATAGFHTFTCSGGACGLAANTTYYALMRTYDTAGSGYYSLETTVDDGEALTPANNGWSIANATLYKTGTGSWTELSRSRAAIMMIAAAERTSLAASSITDTSATLTIAGHTGNWHHKETHPTAGTCSATANTGLTATAGSLTADKLYGYTAYGDSGCTAAKALATTYFSTTDVGAGNLGTANSTVSVGAAARTQWVNAFTAGSHPDGYDLAGVTLDFAAKAGSPGNISVAIHKAHATKSEPAATAEFTLSGSNPDTAGLYTYACPANTDCELSSGTKYYVVVKAASSGADDWYTLRLTSADAETLHPANNGWSIANTARFHVDRGAWKDDTHSESVVMHLAANEIDPHVTNLATASSGDSDITSSKQQGVDFTTGPSSGGYTLDSVTIPMRLKTAGTGTLAVTLHADNSGSPADAALAATFTGTAPTTVSSNFTNTVWTCSGSGCELQNGKKYYVVATLTGTGAYAWSFASGTAQESTKPSDSGWDIGGDHFKNTGQDWSSRNGNHLFRADFTFKPSLAASSITDTSATLTLSGYSGSWWLKSDVGHNSANCESASGNTYHTYDRLQKRTTYLYTAYSDDGCTKALATETFTTTGAAISFSSIASTTATMTIAGHTGAWWYKADTGPDNTCTSAATTAVAAGTTESLTGLTDGGIYTYTAYSATGCADANALDTATLTMSDVSAGNLDGSVVGMASCSIGYNNVTRKCASSFTTGPNHAGYTLKSLTARFDSKRNTPSDLVVALHAADTTNSSHPASAATVTLSGSNPDAAGLHTYTCSGSGCDLAANTTYFIVMSNADTSGNNLWFWRTTASNAETLTPAGNGWSIADGGLQDTGSGWSTLARYAAPVMHAAADAKVGFTATTVASTSATLTLSGHTDAWHYKRIHGPTDAACRSVAKGTVTASPPGLAANTPLYGYTAYTGANCTGTAIATGYFSTADAYVENLDAALSDADGIVGNIIGNVVQRAAAFDTGNAAHGYTLKGVTLRFSATTGSPANVVVAVHEPASAGSSDPKAAALVTLSGANQPGAGLHTYACSSGCGLDRNSTYFVVVSAPNSPLNGYHSLKLTTSNDETLYPAGSGWSIADTGRVKGGSNAWTASSGGETAVMHVAAEENTGLTASNIGATTATLTPSGYLGNWRYKYTTPATPAGACSAAQTGATANVTGLTANTAYVFKLYAGTDATCATPLATAVQFTTLTSGSGSSLTATGVTATSATLSVPNHSGAWYYQISGGSGSASGGAGAAAGAAVAGAASASSGPGGQTVNGCVGPINGQASLTQLSSNTTYTITAYTGQCHGEAIASGSFATIQSGTLTMRRLHATSAVLDVTLSANSFWHYQADTGPHSTACSGRLNVHNDAYVSGLTPLTQYTYKAYTDSNCANEVASITFTTLRADLVMSSLTAESMTLTPNPAHWPSATTYWLKGKALAGCEPYTGSANNIRLWPRSQFTFEMHSTSSCTDSPHLGYFEIIGPYAPLTATHVSANSATLELGGWTQYDWWYKRTEPSGDNTCHKKDAGDTTVTLTGLQPNTQYAYWVIRSSDCADYNSLRSTASPGITFTTVSMAASEPGATTATITLNGGQHGQPWWYAETAMNPSYQSGQPFQSNCHYGGTARNGGSSVVVRGLEPGNGSSAKPYTFTAYSDAACSVDRAMGSVNADTLWPTLRANTLGGGGARLTLGNWGANDPDWHYRVNVVVPHSGNIVLHGADGCLGPVTGGALQVDVTSLPPLSGYGAYYIFTAHSASGCHYSKTVASALLS